MKLWKITYCHGKDSETHQPMLWWLHVGATDYVEAAEVFKRHRPQYADQVKSVELIDSQLAL